MARKLTTNVRVGGTWYGPSYPDNEVTPEVAKQITNPNAWEGDQEPEPAQAATPAAEPIVPRRARDRG